MYPVKNPARDAHNGNVSSTRWTAIKLLLVSLLTASIPLAMYVRVDSKASAASVAVQAAGQGKPYFNFRDGRPARVDYQGEQNLTAALQSGQAQPRSLASTVLAADAVPDLITGYAYNGMGIVTVQHGNPEAFAPKDDSIFLRMQQGYNPDSLLPVVETYLVPESPDFLEVGDFNYDNRKDVLVGMSGGGLYLLSGDGRGALNAPEQISLPGVVTSVATGEFRVADGWPEVAIGVNGPSGAAVLIFDGRPGLTGEPMTVQLSAPASAMQIERLDDDPFRDVAVAEGDEIAIIHGWSRKQEVNPQMRIERISSGYHARDLAVGFFLWNRQVNHQIAALSDDGTIHILDRAGSDARPFTDQELAKRSKGQGINKRFTADAETVAAWQPGDAVSWNTAREYPSSASVSETVFQKSHISYGETDEILISDVAAGKLNLVHQNNEKVASLSATNDLVSNSVGTDEPPAAFVALPQKLNGYRDLIVVKAGSASPTIIPLAPTATPTVDRNDDPAVAAAGAGAASCTGAANDCSLRGAVLVANANPGSTITIPAGTFNLTIAGDANDRNFVSFNPLIGDLNVNASGTTINGAGSGSTTIQQTTFDRVLVDNATGAAGFVFTISGLKAAGGRYTEVNLNIGGAGMFLGGNTNTTTVTNCLFVNNLLTLNGGGSLGGGAINITGGNTNITGTTFGGVGATDFNQSVTSGGGLSYDASDFITNGLVGILTLTNSTFINNTAVNHGGGMQMSNSNLASTTVNVSGGTFTGNTASATSGALALQTGTLTVASTTFTNNTAVTEGGAIHVGGGPGMLLDGSSGAVTFTGNTAPFGSSVSNSGPVNVSGTQVTIGGSVGVDGGGIWTNNAGSTLNPTNIDIRGGTFNCNNSTMNVAGNLALGPSGNNLIPGAFNAGSGTVNIAGNITTNNTAGTSFSGGTGLFNFNGAGAQSITGTLSPTFNNLTVNKTGGSTLTLGVNTPITGNLSVTQGNFNLVGFTANRTVAGGTLTVSNGAALRIGGTGTLPSNFSTHSIGATSTIEYNGTNQTVATLNSAQKYGNLILSGSGTKTLAGAISVATSLTINGTATLDASASNFNIDNAGNWNNNVAAANFNPRAATVTFSSGAQTIGGSATSQTFNNIVMNNTSLTVGGSTTTLNINGNLTLTAGIFSPGTAANINIGGNWTNNIGPGGFVPGTGTVTFNSTTAGQAINGTAASQTFNNLTVSKTGQALSFGGSTTQLDLNGNFNLTAGTVTAPATINANADWTVATGAIFTPGAGTVNFNGSGARNINGTATLQAFNNLVINKSGGGSVTNSGSATSYSVSGGITLTAGTFAPAAVTINLAGNWTNNGGTLTPGTSTVVFNNGAAPQSITGTAVTQTFNNISVTKSAQSLSVGGSTTTLNLNGNMNIASGNFNVGTAANVNVGGNWTLDNTATFTPGAGTNTVTFNGAGAQSLNGTATTQAFNNFTVNKTAGTLSGGGLLATLTINKDFTITQGTFAPGATLLTINESGGNWTNNGTFTAGTGTVIFNANGIAQTLSGSTTFNNLTINHTGAGTVDASGSTLAVTGLLRIQQGTFISSSQFNNVQIDSGTTLQGSNGTTMSVSGNWTNNGGTFTPSGNTVNFNGAGAQTIGGTATTQTFNNFTVNKGGGTLSVVASTTALDINGNVTLTAGTFAAGTATTINVGGNWTNNATFTPGAGTVIFDGNNNTQTLAGNTTFNNLTINHTGTGNVTAAGSTLTVGSLLRVQGGTFIVGGNTLNNVQIDSGQTLQGTNATTVNVSGNWTNNSGTFTANGNTVNFNGGAAQSINGTATTQTFDNLTVNKTVGIAVTVGGSTTTLDINGNVMLTQGIFASGTATAITVAGNWTNNGGVFTPGAGTVTFDGGGGQTIGGSTATTFNNLTNGNASGLAMSFDNTVNGILALTSSDITVAATRTLTQPLAGSSTGTFDVNGRVQRNGFVLGGAALSFGNPFNTIQVTAGTAPANIVVDLTRSVPTGTQGFPTAVQRYYTITPSAAGFTGTLRLHYLDSELNSNVEGPNFIFRRFTSGIGWQPVLPTSSDFTNNWLEATGVTQFSPWTFNSTLAPTAANGVITGRIVDDNGAPVEGAVVRLQGTQNRKFITDANGFYRFDNVETNGFYTVTPARANYSFSPAERSFSLVGQTTEATFGATAASSGLVNPLDTPEYFVRQHYLDFLNREPDEAGFNFWSDQIIGCGTDQGCIERKRVNVSAAYFLSIEFQRTGGLVDGLYRAAYGARPDFAHFLPDTRTVGNGVRVGSDGWEALLAANTEAFVNSFVNRAEFHAAYDNLSNADYVDTLISHTGVSFTSAEREALLSGLGTGSMTRAQALRSIAEDGRFVSVKFNETFVMMEYFGYLRRDADANGFAFWLNKLNQFNGNFEQAEMVKAFIVSGEYRDRFPR